MTVRPDYPDPIPRKVSPDGSVVVLFTASEMRMSVWVHEPLVYRARDGLLVLDLGDTLLDSAPATSFPAPHRVRLGLRKYPDGSRVRYDLVVDVEEETFGLGEGAVPDRPLADIGKALPELRDRDMPPVDAEEARRTKVCPRCGGTLAEERGLLDRVFGTWLVRCGGCGRSWTS